MLVILHVEDLGGRGGERGEVGREGGQEREGEEREGRREREGEEGEGKREREEEEGEVRRERDGEVEERAKVAQDKECNVHKHYLSCSIEILDPAVNK